MKNSDKQQSRKAGSSKREPLWLRVDGIVPAKKNRRVIFKGKSFPNEEYRKWERKVKAQAREVLYDLTADPTTFGLDGPCTVKLVFAFADKRRRDVDNMVSSWLDALQEARIIRDDCWTCIGSPTVVIMASDHPWSGALIEDGNRKVQFVLDELDQMKVSECGKS